MSLLLPGKKSSLKCSGHSPRFQLVHAISGKERWLSCLTEYQLYLGALQYTDTLASPSENRFTADLIQWHVIWASEFV